MKRRHKIALGLIGLTAVATTAYNGRHQIAPTLFNPPIANKCDITLWNHVYHGKFANSQDRLVPMDMCKMVTGTIVNAVKEADGDWHIRLDVDDKSLLNAKNISSQHGYLVLEAVCENPVTQADTINEGVCDNFHQSVFDTSMIGKRVSVRGAYVLDAEHGWNEIHPVDSISIIN